MDQIPSHDAPPADVAGTPPRARVLPRLRRPLLLALLLTVALLGAYQVVEGLWLGHLDDHLLHALHLLRGVVLAVLAATVVGWLVLRASPPLLTAPAPVAASGWPRLTRDQRIRHYARWLALMRWLAVAAAGALVYLATAVFDEVPARDRAPLIAVVVLLGLLNLLYIALERRGHLRYLLQVQVYADLLLLVMLLHHSGGVENPLALLMLFHVIIGGIIFSRGQCFVVAAIATALFALMALGEVTGLLPHSALGIFPHYQDAAGGIHAARQPVYVACSITVQAAVLFLTAYFVTTLGQRLRDDERQFELLAQQALAERQLLERALDTTQTGLRVLDARLQPHWMNQQWQQWFAGPAGAGAGAPAPLHGPDGPAAQTLRDGEVRITELELGPRSYRVTTAPLRDAQGRASQVVELARDVTEQRDLAAQMVRAGKLAAIGALAGEVAHEVNNPVGIISAKTRLLLADRRGEMSPKIAQELAKITDLCDRVARITQGLLSSSRPSTAVRTPLHLEAPMRRALGLIEDRARQHQVRVVDRLGGPLPLVIANAGEVEQVFLNLLLNALDAMPAGGTLTVAPGQDHADGPRWLTITVTDTGAGIPPAVRERIFEPFFTTKEEGRGTGLGLAICQGLVRSHGGQIEVESPAPRTAPVPRGPGAGPGTCVTVRLPLAEFRACAE